MQEPVLISPYTYTPDYVYKIWYDGEPHMIYIGSTNTPIMTRLSQHARDTGNSKKAKWIQANKGKRLRIQRIANAKSPKDARIAEYIAILAYEHAGYTLMNQRMPIAIQTK